MIRWVEREMEGRGEQGRGEGSNLMGEFHGLFCLWRLMGNH